MMLSLYLLLLIVISPVEGDLQCPSCTYITISPEVNIPSLFRGAIDSVLGLFQDDECSKVLKGPVPEIKEATCRKDGGKENRCSFYAGDLTLTVPVIGSEIPFKIYQRGCYSALPANIPRNGCHNRANINEDKTFLKHIVDQTTNALSSWDVANFDGELCLCSTTYCTDISGVSQGAVLYPLMFMLQFILLYFL